MTIQEEVMRLVHEAPHPPRRGIPRGAGEEQIEDFEARIGLEIPRELWEWLRRCNGPNIGPGGLYGIDTSDGPTNIEDSLSRHPRWKDRGWFPIAGDGCGSHYVLDTGHVLKQPGYEAVETHPVYFMDHEYDEVTPAYVVASGLWQFLRFLLTREILHEEGIEEYWPFDEARVLQEDPALASYQGDVPLAWEDD